LSGEAQLSLAVGVEKTFFPDDAAKTLEIFEGGIDQLDPQEWHEYYRRAGEVSGKPFNAHAGGGTLFMDTYAMQAAYHMKTFGTTREQIAFAASKNHAMGALNPKAQYRFTVSPEEVLADREISWPLTRAMCSPIGDGAAGALLCSDSFLKTLPRRAQERAISVSASVLTGGKYRALDEPGLSHVAAKKAYAKAGLTPADIDVAEVHDATSFCEIYQAEMLGFCEVGKGGAFVGSGATSLGGRQPINLSGGLVSKGHPVGATGLSMIHELVSQLRGECGARQSANADIALAENGGGVIGFDEAACSITILRR
jgi:acetyl-CoA acetyltransferase